MDAVVKPTDPLQDQDPHSLTPSPPRSVGCYQPQDGSHPGNTFGQRELPHHSWESARIHDWSIWGYKSLAPWPKIQSWTFWRDIQAPKLPMGSAEVSVWLQGWSITLFLPHLLHSFSYRSCSWDHSPINFLHPPLHESVSQKNWPITAKNWEKSSSSNMNIFFRDRAIKVKIIT